MRARPAARPALVQHVEARAARGSPAARLASAGIVSSSSARPSSAAKPRAASSDPSSSELGLVDSTSVTARSTACSSSQPAASRPRCSIADCVRLPTILCVLDTTRSAPAASACSGSASWNARCAPHASSTTSGTPCSCATSLKPAHVGDGAEVGRATRRSRRPRPGVAVERRVERLGREAMRDAELGVDLRGDERRAQAGQRPARRSCSSGRCAAPPPARRAARAPRRRRGCPARRR